MEKKLKRGGYFIDNTSSNNLTSLTSRTRLTRLTRLSRLHVLLVLLVFLVLLIWNTPSFTHLGFREAEPLFVAVIRDKVNVPAFSQN
jgi:hypothetical protein